MSSREEPAENLEAEAAELRRLSARAQIELDELEARLSPQGQAARAEVAAEEGR